MSDQETEVKEEELKGYTIPEFLLFKLDRTLAIVGLVAVALTALWVNDISEPAKVVVSGIAGGLGVYLGVRGSK